MNQEKYTPKNKVRVVTAASLFDAAAPPFLISNSSFLIIQYLHLISLAPQPHIDADPIGFGSDGVNALFFFQNLCCRKSIQHGFYGRAAVGEGHTAERSRVHELDAPPKFTIFEAVGIGDLEGLSGLLHLFDAVDAEDGGVFAFFFFE